MTPQMKLCQIAPHPPLAPALLSSPSQPFITSPITIFSFCQSRQSGQNIATTQSPKSSSLLSILPIFCWHPPPLLLLWSYTNSLGRRGAWSKAKPDKSKPAARWRLARMLDQSRVVTAEIAQLLTCHCHITTQMTTCSGKDRMLMIV